MSIRLILYRKTFYLFRNFAMFATLFIFMDFEFIAFIESIQTWNYVDVYMCWK